MAIFIRQVIPFHCTALFYVCTVCSYNEHYLLADSVWGVDTSLLADYVCLNLLADKNRLLSEHPVYLWLYDMATTCLEVHCKGAKPSVENTLQVPTDEPHITLYM